MREDEPSQIFIITDLFILHRSCHSERSEGLNDFYYDGTVIPNEVRDLILVLIGEFSFPELKGNDYKFEISEIPHFVRDTYYIILRNYCPSLRSG